MAFEIVDGMTGTKHISSDDLSALNVATIGKANCVLEYGDGFKLTMASANDATLGTGVGMVDGKRFWNQAATSLKVQSGTQGQKRNDLVVARYAKTGAGIESITPVVIKGTPSTGTAADPATTSNDLKLWRIPLNGISVGTPVKLFTPVTPLATLEDSVSSETGFQFLYGKTFSEDHVAYRKKGFLVEMFWHFHQETADLWNAGTLPVEFRPAHSFLMSSVRTRPDGIVSNNTAEVEVQASGAVVFISAASMAGGGNVGHCVWIAG